MLPTRFVLTSQNEIKIEIAEGAFDSVITHMESEAKCWKLIKEQCKKDDSLPVRIGYIIPAKPPELHLCGEIFEK